MGGKKGSSIINVGSPSGSPIGERQAGGAQPTVPPLAKPPALQSAELASQQAP